MNEIIKIDSDNKVSGRELHDFLEVGTAYKDWFPRMCEYGFAEGEDFNVLKNERVQIEGGRKVKRLVDDASMTIDMAKEICMIQRTDKGKQARQYFIECERRLKLASTPQDSYMISDPVQRAKKWIEEEQERQRLASSVKELTPKAEFFDAVADSTDLMAMGEAAKTLKRVGRNTLFKLLKKHKVLDSENIPYQRYCDTGYFKVIESTYGNGCIGLTTKVTQRGLDWLRKFLDKVEAE